MTASIKTPDGMFRVTTGQLALQASVFSLRAFAWHVDLRAYPAVEQVLTS
jgi:hypothetical protein